MNKVIENKDCDKVKETIKYKVKSFLLKRGNNVNDVEEMMLKHFDWGFKNYDTINDIASMIRTIY